MMNIRLTITDFAALSPLLILLGAALVILLIESFTGAAAKKISFFLCAAAFAGAICAAFYAPASNNLLLTPWLRFDSLAHLFTLFFLFIGLGSAFLAASFFKKFEASHGEFYFLLLSSVFGLILIGAAADFLTLFLGLETLSISLYVLCGYIKKWKLSNESSIKYFLIGSLAAAVFLYGIALIYGAVGTTHLEGLLGAYRGIASAQSKILFLSGIALVTLGLAFKAAVVPFHVWAPDVYDGAPTPVTAFMAVGTKTGAYAAFVLIFFIALPQFDSLWNQGIAWLAYPTLIYANFVAMRQTQLRRFFAYSGISHSGFLLIPLAAGTPDALPALIFYLIVYAFATLGSFAVLSFLDNHSDGVFLNDLHGLFRRAPFLAGILALCLLTLAGIPPTVGFFAKFYIFKVAFHAGYYTLVIVGLLTTILSAYYYLRIIAIMLSKNPAESAPPSSSWPAAILGTLSFAAIIILSIFPAPLLSLLAIPLK